MLLVCLESAIVEFSSHTHFLPLLYFPVNKHKLALIRLHGCAGCSQYFFFIIFCIRETPKRVLMQTVKAKMKCSIITCISLGPILRVKIKRSSGKLIHFVFFFFFEKLQPDTLYTRYVQCQRWFSMRFMSMIIMLE